LKETNASDSNIVFANNNFLNCFLEILNFNIDLENNYFNIY